MARGRLAAALKAGEASGETLAGGALLTQGFWGTNQVRIAATEESSMKPPDPETTDAQNVSRSALPKVIEAYSGYTPPFDVKADVEKMVASVPPRFLVGLKEILLTNTAGLPRKLRRGVTKSRKKKFRMVESRGLYHPAWNNRPAWIEIFVDNALAGQRKGHLWWLFPRDLHLQDIVFHEIGHHIHFAVRPEHREREDVADVWKLRLTRNYNRQHHRLIRATLRTIRFFFKPLYRAFYRKTMDENLEKGLISRAEYDESMK
jgi:hypothetical protein